MVTQYKNLIGGEMVGTDRWLDVVNPANEQVIGQVPDCGQEELDRAVAAQEMGGESHSESEAEFEEADLQ